MGVRQPVNGLRNVRVFERIQEGGDGMSRELKRCPFCGNKPTIRIFRGKDGWRDRYAVLCRYDEGGCGAESGLYHYEDEAIEAWNRRVTE